MSSPTDHPDGRDGDGSVPGPRDVVWTVGRGSGRAPGSALRGWLVLLVLAGVTAFVLAYVVHGWLGGEPTPAGPGAPLWLPERLPADGCGARNPA